MVLLGLVGVGLVLNGLSCDVGSCTPLTNEEVAKASAKASAEQEALKALYGGQPPADGDCGGDPVPVHPFVDGTVWGYADLGRQPVWLSISGLEVDNETHAVLHMSGTGIKKTAGGFPISLKWVTDASFTDVIHVRITQQSGAELSSKPAGYMHDPNLLVPSESKATSVGTTPAYRIFTTVATFPTSPGCYVATAAWLGDEWSIPIAIGL